MVSKKPSRFEFTFAFIDITGACEGFEGLRARVYACERRRAQRMRLAPACAVPETACKILDHAGKPSKPSRFSIKRLKNKRKNPLPIFLNRLQTIANHLLLKKETVIGNYRLLGPVAQGWVVKSLERPRLADRCCTDKEIFYSIDPVLRGRHQDSQSNGPCCEQARPAMRFPLAEQTTPLPRATARSANSGAVIANLRLMIGASDGATILDVCFPGALT